MNELSKSKTDYLNSANSVTSALALFSLVAAVPGGIRLFRFLMDARDDVIETSNLLGSGGLMLPGLDQTIGEPYVSLGILILSVAIPVLIFLFLLLKKQGLKDGRTGTGLYWVIALLGILGILLGTGLVANLYPADPTAAVNFQTQPENLFVAGISAISIITALAAAILVGKAAKAPLDMEDEIEDEDEDITLQIVDRREPVMTSADPIQTKTAVTGSPVKPSSVKNVPVSAQTAASDAQVRAAVKPGEPAPARGAVPSSEPVSVKETVLPSDSPQPKKPTRTTAEKASAPAGETVPVKPAAAGPSLSGKTPAADVPKTAAAIMERDFGHSEDLHPAAAPVREENPVQIASVKTVPVNADPVKAVAVKAVPVKAAPTAARASSSTAGSAPNTHSQAKSAPAEPKERELKRKLIAYPGDDTKVILVIREYRHGKFVREWSEIRLKSDFTKPRRPRS